MKQFFCLTVGMLLIAAIITTTGCQDPAGHERAAVSGSVTLDGEPLATGMITFIPLGEGTASSAPIENGQFSMPEETAPSPGKCRVEVTSMQETGKMIPGMSESGQVPETKQVIPAKYNLNSTLEEEISADGSSVIDIQLTSN